VLLKLAAICDRKDWREVAEKSIRLFAQRIHQIPQAVPHLMLALDFSMQEPKRIALVGDWTCGSTVALLQAAHGTATNRTRSCWATTAPWRNSPANCPPMRSLP
jgi:uncharacterized protein YyaL (SSP411 family)